MAKNRSELVAEVAGKAGTSQAAVNSVLDALFEVFESSVASGEKITIPGWLAVERTDRAARTGRNPQTGETIQIAAGNSEKLTAGSILKAAYNKNMYYFNSTPRCGNNLVAAPLALKRRRARIHSGRFAAQAALADNG